MAIDDYAHERQLAESKVVFRLVNDEIEDVNVSLGVELMRRWFDPYLGFNEAEWFIEPIATLEFVLPASWFGSDRNARLFGRPAIDLQMAYEQNWSNIPAFSYSAWHAGAALKLGWRF